MKSLLALLALTACASRITGNEGNLEFSYLADDDVIDFNKPIAVGASLDITVATAGDHLPVTLTAATSDDEAVLAVAAFEATTVTVTGVADGGALLSVEADSADGTSLPDSINLLVRTPEVLKLWHTCTGTDGTAVYLSGSTVYVPFDLEMSNGQSVIGYGYYPVTTTGTAAVLDVPASDQTWMVFDTATPGTVTLDSDLDDAALTLQVFDASSLNGVAEPIAFVAEDIDVGDVNAFYVHPKVNDVTVCQADTPKEVVSDTPDICDVRVRDSADDDLREWGWFEVEGIAAGVCEYTVTFTAGNAGSGASAQFSYEIQP